jgi:hypothetical protein
VTSRRAIGLLALLSPLLLAASFWGGEAAQWIWAVAVALFPVALIALGVTRGREGLGPLRLPLLLLAAVLTGSLVLLLVLPDGGPTVFGLPLGTAWILFILVPVPLAIVAWAYAFSFDRFWLREEDLERLRQLRSGPREES